MEGLVNRCRKKSLERRPKKCQASRLTRGDLPTKGILYQSRDDLDISTQPGYESRGIIGRGMWIAATRVGNFAGPRGLLKRDESADISVLASEPLGLAIQLMLSRFDN